MQKLVESWKQSDLSQKAFCTLKNANYEKLRYWSNKLKMNDKVTMPQSTLNQPKEVSDFIPIEVPIKINDFSGFELTYPNQVKLNCPLGTDITTLKTLIKLIK